MSRIQKILIGALLVAGALPVHATFPGKNGRIAFIAGPDIYTMSPDGSDVRQLTHLGPGSQASWESWSPDGKQIVFIEHRPPDFRGQLWLMNADGTNQHLLLADADFDDETPSFTPDGNSVSFSRCRLDIEACGLYQIGVNGTVPQAITEFELGIQDFSPKHSPSDGSLAFTSFNRGGIVGAVYLAVRTSDPRQLTPTPLSGRRPDWSPDGRSLAFATHCCNPQNEEIWVTDVESHGLRRLTDNGTDYPTGPHDSHPSWSPQGDAIVFERDAPDFSSSGIFIMKADGSACRKLISLPRSAPMKVPHFNGLRERRGRMGKRHVSQIEEGGALPQWGVAPN